LLTARIWAVPPYFSSTTG